MHSRLKRYLGIGYFVHPLPLIAVALVALNDHVLKRKIPSGFTGKLSDFAGLFFFPVFLCALWNLGRSRWITRTQALIAIAVTDLIFVSVKLSPAVADVYVRALGAIGYPSRVTHDPTDLWALTMNLASYWFMAAQARRNETDYFASK